MTPNQVKLMILDKKKEEVKKFYEELEETVKAVHAEIGINGYFQDSEGIVYKVVVPEYKSIKMDHLSYIRTKRSEERAGTLSAKEAKEQGFDVK